MDFNISRMIRSRYRRLRFEEPQRTPIQNNLSDLPPDILLCITDFLPTSSAAALALCNRTFLEKLGTGFFEAINSEILPAWKWELTDSEINAHLPSLNEIQKQREAFMELLDRDLPHLINCQLCRTFHEPKNTGVPTMLPSSSILRGSSRACTAVESFPHRRAWSHPEFTFTKVHMAMKRYRLGLDYSEDLKQLSKSWEMRCLGSITKCSSICRIVEGSLLVRTRAVLFIRTKPYEAPEVPGDVHLEACQHNYTVRHKWSNSCPQNLFEEIVECRVSDETTGSCPCVTSCPACPTLFHVGCQQLSSKEWAVIVTTWKDFGKGMSPFDPKWVDHRAGRPPIYQNYTTIKKAFGDVESEIEIKPLSIMEKLSLGLGI